MKIDLTTIRRQAESLLVDDCTITRETVSDPNDTTGMVTYTITATVYAGPCMFVGAGGGAQDEFLQLALPYYVGVQRDDVVTITNSQDETAVGQRFTVVNASKGTYTALRTVQMVQRTRPGE